MERIPQFVHESVCQYLKAIDLVRWCCIERHFLKGFQLYKILEQRFNEGHFDISLHRKDFQTRRMCLLWLKRLHNIETYSFQFGLDLLRKSPKIYILDKERRKARWIHEQGTVYGDTECRQGLVSYWEVTGVSDTTFVGIAEVIGSECRSFGLRLGRMYTTLKYLEFSPGCNHVPAIMYSGSGFITNGAYRGPKPMLPGYSTILAAERFGEKDTIGVFVDLLEGSLIFFKNDSSQGTTIPLDRTKKYYPIISDSTSDLVIVHTNVIPPWQSVYAHAA